jgi:hypothetical protein
MYNEIQKVISLWISSFEGAVLSQLKAEREVDLHFNLIEILADEAKKREFLKELFHYQIRIE